MKALFIAKPGKAEVREIEKPSPNKEQVLIKVGKVGFCGGDLNGFRGSFALQEYPVILGHEMGGIIEELGKNVPSDFSQGMKVTVYPYKNCAKCVACRTGLPNACIDNRTMGVRRPGAVTDYIVVPYRDIYPSRSLTTSELALVEPLAVGFHAVKRGQIKKNDIVVVFGCGVVGIGAIKSAAIRGAKVIAVDIDEKKISIAQDAGAMHGINSTKTDVISFIDSITNGDGPNVVIEAIGNPATFRLAVDIVRFTGTVVYIGYAKKSVEYDTGVIVQKELNIFGSRNSLGDFPDVIKMLEAGSFPVNKVISKVVTLEKAGDALARWSQCPGEFTKILVNLE